MTTPNPPALPAGNLLADSYIADLAQLATERFPLDEEMRYYAGRLRNGVVKLLAERTARAAAEQRAGELEARERALRELIEETDVIIRQGALEDEEGFISIYQVRAGRWHKFLAWARNQAATPATGGAKE